MFKSHAGEDLISQLDFMAEYGFKSFEDNEMRMRPKATQNQIAETLIKNGMTMGVFVGHKIYWDQPNLTSGNTDLRDEFLADIRSSIEVAKRVNAKWMTVVPGYVDLKLQEGYQTAHLIEALRRACDLLEPEGLVMVLEPLNPRDHAGQFLSKIPQAMRSVGLLTVHHVRFYLTFIISKSLKVISFQILTIHGLKLLIFRLEITLVVTNRPQES